MAIATLLSGDFLVVPLHQHAVDCFLRTDLEAQRGLYGRLKAPLWVQLTNANSFRRANSLNRRRVIHLHAVPQPATVGYEAFMHGVGLVGGLVFRTVELKH